MTDSCFIVSYELHRIWFGFESEYLKSYVFDLHTGELVDLAALIDPMLDWTNPLRSYTHTYYRDGEFVEGNSNFIWLPSMGSLDYEIVSIQYDFEDRFQVYLLVNDEKLIRLSLQGSLTID